MEHSLLAVEREIVVMKLVDHPNILKLYDVWETSSSLYLILEYVQGGELFDYLCSEGRRPTHEALDYFQQIICAVNYCHQFNIAHRDLKLENILIDQNSNIKVADFGMATWQDSSRGNLLRTSCGSPHYAAPEVISGKPYEGAAADIWSCGIILFALLAAKLPFDDDDCPALLQKIAIGKFDMPNDIDPQAQNLIARMLTTDAAKRITMVEIMRHPFFQSCPLKNPSAMASNLYLDYIAQPITSRSAIDPDIFANLRILWRGMQDSDLVDALLSSEHNWQKGVYHLLCNYRRKYLDGRHGEEEPIRAKKQKKVVQRAQDIHHTESIHPPRSGPPTPRRARGVERPMSYSMMTFVHVQKPDQSAPLIHLSAPSPEQKTSATLPEADKYKTNLSMVAAPELEDKRIQAFFQQVANHINILQARTASINLPKSPTGEDTPPVLKLPAMPSTSLLSYQLGSRIANLDNPYDGSPLKNSGIRPLSVRRKSYQPSLKTRLASNKENLIHVTESDLINRQSPLMQHASKMIDHRGGVQVFETPTPIQERSRRGKERYSSSNVPVSPIFSEAGSPSTTSSPGSSGAPKRWLDNVFKFKAANYNLLSRHDIHITQSECRRLLMEMDLLVSLEESEKLGVLKCRALDMKNGNKMTQGFKSVKFRVEMQWPTPQLCHEDYLVSLQFIQEKGSLEAFKGIFQQLARNWTLDRPMAATN